LIFVTVGGQLPFDRLVESVDQWAARRGRSDVFAQIAEASYAPRSIEAQAFLSPDEFARRMAEATAVVSHAGMGTILTVLELGKPALVLPRRLAFRETRNDHQVETARRFAERGLLLAAQDQSAMPDLLDRLESHPGPARIGRSAAPELVRRLREYALAGLGDPELASQ